jgi:uncharacterized protein (TIGR02246 family)
MRRMFGLALLVSSHLLAATPEQEIRAVFDAQLAAWNRGDIEGFMKGYADSPETTFVGKEVRKGYASVLARYRRDYPDRDHMGETTFSDIEIRMIRDDIAIVVGRFHLSRGAQFGGDASGIFTLVVEKTADGWKILHDHTS